MWLFTCYVNLTYEQTEELLSKLSLASARNCSQWVNTIIDEDDLCVILRDKRSSYKHISFYQEFAELEAEAKAFVLSSASTKEW